MPEAMGNRLISSSLAMTGGFAYGATNAMGTTQTAMNGQQDPSVNNIRVKLPDKDDDDLSEADNEAEKEMEANERMKIKLEAQLRYDRMAKNKMKGKMTTGGTNSQSNLGSTQKKK